MTTPITDRNAGDVLPENVEQSRWGIRLRELSSGATAPAPEPLEWRPKPTFWQRVRRGTALPLTAAAVVFIAIVLISITTVWLRPHTVDQEASALGAEALAGAPGPSGSAGLAGSADSSRKFGSTDNGVPTAVSGSADRGVAGADTGSGLVAPKSLYIHVVGEVNLPGLYELKAGSRALAAVEAAGGATAGAVLSGLNLARPLVDGEQLVVPDAEGAQRALASGIAGASPEAGTSTGNGGLVSLNSADQSAFETLPRVGPALAQRIIDWRSANGGFQSVEQLLNVSGIGQKTFEQLSNLVTL